MSEGQEIPEDLYFTEEHEWVKIADSEARIGISDHAQDQLGDIVFVELPEKGEEISKGSEVGAVESIKAVSSVYAPLSGEVKEINENLEDRPELINEDPYESGWLCLLEPSDLEDELGNLMGSGEYQDFLESEG